jgi:hypothetical protein
MTDAGGAKKARAEEPAGGADERGAIWRQSAVEL